MPKYLALSVVAPHGGNIASGRKTLEVRTWRPPELPVRNLLIVENMKYLTEDGQIDEDGRAVALVDVRLVETWLPSQVAAACSAAWQPGYHARHLENVRPISSSTRVPAARKLYMLDFVPDL